MYESGSSNWMKKMNLPFSSLLPGEVAVICLLESFLLWPESMYVTAK